MDTTLSATRRDPSDRKGGARKLRATGQLPAVVYGKSGEATPITVDPSALVEMFRASRDRNTVVRLVVDEGEARPCLVREVQKHPLRRDILHVDFHEVDAETPVQVMVPVTTEGRAVGVTAGGRIRVIRRELPVRCSFEKIPKALTIDVTPLDIGDFVKAGQISVPEGVEIAVEADLNIVSCYGRRAAAAAPAAPEKKGKK